MILLISIVLLFQSKTTLLVLNEGAVTHTLHCTVERYDKSDCAVNFFFVDSSLSIFIFSAGSVRMRRCPCSTEVRELGATLTLALGLSRIRNKAVNRLLIHEVIRGQSVNTRSQSSYHDMFYRAAASWHDPRTAIDPRGVG